MSLARRLFNNTLLLYGGDQIGNFLQLAFFLVIAGLFGEAPMGRYAEALALVGVFALLADLGIVEYTIRHVARDGDPTRAGVARALVLRAGAVVLWTGAALAASPLLFAGRPEETYRLFLLLGAWQIQVSVADVLLGELKGAQLMGRVAAANVSMRLAVVAIGSVLLARGVPFTTVIAAFPVAGFVYLALAATASVRRFGPPPLGLVRGGDLLALARSLLPFGTAILFNEAVARQDVIILSRLSTAEETGVYWVALKFATVFLGLSAFFQHAIYPMLSKLHVTEPARLEKVCRQVTRYLLMVALPLSAGLSAIADRLILLLYRGRFEGSIACLRIMAWVVAIGLAHATFSALLSAVGRQNQKALSLGVNLAIGVTLNMLLVPLLAAKGAAIVRVVVEIVPLFLFGWLARRVLPGWNPLRDAVRPAIACGLMVLAVRWLSEVPLPLAILAGAAVYGIGLVAIGGVKREDITRLRELIPASGADVPPGVTSA